MAKLKPFKPEADLLPEDLAEVHPDLVPRVPTGGPSTKAVRAPSRVRAREASPRAGHTQPRKVPSPRQAPQQAAQQAPRPSFPAPQASAPAMAPPQAQVRKCRKAPAKPPASTATAPTTDKLTVTLRLGEPVASMFQAIADAYAVDNNAAGAILVRKGYLAMVEAGDVPPLPGPLGVNEPGN